MCGLFGWVGTSPDDADDVLRQQLHLLTHRGPDDAGAAHGPDWGLGFRRLSILDLSPTGHQPMSTPDGRYSLVFNGEIYNHVELRQQLLACGTRLRGTSDTEVLLHLLARDGADALTRLNGMFALALVDHHRGRFLLARDRLGKKPLYYRQVGDQLRFASELKALLSWPDGRTEIDRDAVAEYLVHGNVRASRSIFEGYRRLAPGHVLEGRIGSPGGAEARRWWRVEVNPAEHGAPLGQEDLDELLELLQDAVRVRLRSDVPVGLFLSGGIDSGLVAVLAGAAATGPAPSALTVGFDEADHDETALAALAASRAGLQHVVVPVEASRLEDVDRLAWFFDEPFADSSALPTMALCAAAAEHGKVFLAGDGGDEAFAGYRRYTEALQHPWIGRIPAAGRAGAAALAGALPLLSRTRYRLCKVAQPGDSYASTYDAVPTDPVLRYLCHPDLRPRLDRVVRAVPQEWAALGSGHLTARQQQQDYDSYLPDDILPKVDRASMAASIEVRSPLLDHRLVEWAARLPRAALLNGREGKLPLRTLGRRLLPPEVLDAPKRGFAVPVDSWLAQPAGQALLRDRLLSDEAAARGLFDVTAARHVIARHAQRRGRSVGSLLWRLLVLDAWCRLYLDGPVYLCGPPGGCRRSNVAPAGGVGAMSSGSGGSPAPATYA